MELSVRSSIEKIFIRQGRARPVKIQLFSKTADIHSKEKV